MAAKKRGNGQGTAYKENGTWRACIVLGYEPVEMPDGTVRMIVHRKRKRGFPTKSAALAYCESLRKQSLQIRLLNFLDLYKEWESGYAGRVSKSTMDCYKAAKKYFEPLYFDIFYDIRLEDLQACIDECPKGKRTKENMKALAGLLYKYAIPRKQAENINLAEFLKISGESGTYPAFTMDQVRLIQKAAAANVPHADDVLCLIYLGFRPVEFFSLTKSSYYKLENDGYLVGGAKTEAGKGRAVTVSPIISDIIRKRLESEHEWLFPKDDGTQMSPEYFRDNYFYQVLAITGIQAMPTKEKPAYYVPYSCRHTFSNMLANVSGADKDKAALIGHEDYTTTKKMYQSAEIENLLRITNQFPDPGKRKDKGVKQAG